MCSVEYLLVLTRFIWFRLYGLLVPKYRFRGHVDIIDIQKRARVY